METIATCMGCVVATCVADVDQLPRIVQGMVGWAKPIMLANEKKMAVCAAFRKQVLEPEHAVMMPGGGQLQMVLVQQQHEHQGAQVHVDEDMDKMTVGALFVAENKSGEKKEEGSDAPEELEQEKEEEVTYARLGPEGWLKRLYI